MFLDINSLVDSFPNASSKILISFSFCVSFSLTNTSSIWSAVDFKSLTGYSLSHNSPVSWCDICTVYIQDLFGMYFTDICHFRNI